MNEHPVRWWNYLLLVTPPLFVGAVFLMSVLMRHSFDVYLVVSFFVGAGIASIAGLGNMASSRPWSMAFRNHRAASP